MYVLKATASCYNQIDREIFQVLTADTDEYVRQSSCNLDLTPFVAPPPELLQIFHSPLLK